MPGDALPELSIVIPAFNEAERLPAFLDAVLAWRQAARRNAEILVVDDGSRDNTAELVLQRAAREPALRLVRHLQNAGKGAAVRTGMAAARARLRLFADADGATGMAELAALERAVEAGAAIAIGSREGEGTLVQCSPLRRFLGRWFNRAVRMGSVRGLRDTQCGFKLFVGEQAWGLFLQAQEDGWAFDVEVLFLAQKRGLKIAEVPVNWTEKAGSKVSLWRDGMKMLKAVRRVVRRWRHGEYDRAQPRVTPSREETPSIVPAKS